jgi:hypothetical protein
VQWRTKEFVCCESTYSVEDKGQRVRGYVNDSHLVSGSAQFARKLKPYTFYVVMDVFSMELGIRLSFARTL